MAGTPGDPEVARLVDPRGGATQDFDRVFAGADRIPGWLTREQAQVLYDRAAALSPGSRVVEIGSHQGRSTVVLAAARGDVEVVSVDPFVGAYGGSATAAVFEANLDEAGVSARVRSLRVPSESLRATWTERVDLLYVDGAHDPRHAFDDLQWSRLMSPGGTVLVHDAFSSVGVTLALGTMVLRRMPLRYRGRVGSLAQFDVGPAGFRDHVRMLAELPWFVRNVAVKVLLRLRLHGVAALAGHRGTADPY
jgi:predicted O-methyltransferase YrrM